MPLPEKLHRIDLLKDKKKQNSFHVLIPIPCSLPPSLEKYPETLTIAV